MEYFDYLYLMCNVDSSTFRAFNTRLGKGTFDQSRIKKAKNKKQRNKAQKRKK